MDVDVSKGSNIKYVLLFKIIKFLNNFIDV